MLPDVAGIDRPFDYVVPSELDDLHMGRATFTLVDDDHYTVEWCSCTGGKPDEAHRLKVECTRKK